MILLHCFKAYVYFSRILLCSVVRRYLHAPRFLTTPSQQLEFLSGHLRRFPVTHARRDALDTVPIQRANPAQTYAMDCATPYIKRCSPLRAGHLENPM